MKRLPSFSVILVFVVLIVMGAGVTPLLNIQYQPTKKQNNLSVSFNWPDASAKLVEMEVTSKIEGLAASIKGVEGVSSVSKKERGNVDITFKKNTNMESARFELATLIRQIYKGLPDGVSYPSISATSSGASTQSILTFTVNADIPTQQIETYCNDHIVKAIGLIEGVSNVELTGATPFYRELSFDPQQLASYGVSGADVAGAISSAFAQAKIVGSIDNVGILLDNDIDATQLEQIPIKSVNGRVVRVGDVAKMEFKEKVPTIYKRINGLNTINISIYPEMYVNTIDVCERVKAKMMELSTKFPDKFAVIVAYDSSIDLKEEINKIVVRTVLSLIILLLFVLIVSRSFKYLAAISIALAANIFIAFLFYVFLDLEIHLYSMAGITVSLGIIIDTSIVMVAHYGYYKNRKAFLAILGAQLTSIGALSIVFLLPDDLKANLVDFAAVIIINLAISLITSYLLIPALVDTMHVSERQSLSGLKNKRAIIKFNRMYGKFILFGKKYKWATFVIVILLFGLPVQKLPTRMDYSKGADSTLVNIYNKTLGSQFYVSNMKDVVEKCLGGTMRIFNKRSASSGLGRSPARPVLSIKSSLPDGCTIGQLNEIVLGMENYLSQFAEIDMFNTSITSYKNASIDVYFKKDIENSYIPLMIKSEIIAKASDFGGANWSITGLDDQMFNNHIGNGYKNQRIQLYGYNYDELYKYCQILAENLSKNGRVREPGIYGQVGWGASLSMSEYVIDYDRHKLASYELSLRDAFNTLKEQLYSTQVASYYDENGNKMDIQLASKNRDVFDVWNLKNEYIAVGTKQLRFSDIGKISKVNSGNDIYRENQQYTLVVAYDYVGTTEQARRLQKREVKKMNEEILPIGYKAKGSEDGGWGGRAGLKQVSLMLLVITVIYFVCAVLFESLLLPLVIIGLIPVSIIGVFIIFAITGCRFDQGGFASLVMLAGIVVNAGIYIVNEYRGQMEEKKYRGANLYIRAFNHKIIPILLTVLSTVLGLIPFLMDGPGEAF
ncbi:MAG: efflux RND transporter permease subunit [Bacteroidales bacterium]|nr:efflux RND transporter permease subunit [Bacteroidales bacterium]